MTSASNGDVQSRFTMPLVTVQAPPNCDLGSTMLGMRIRIIEKTNLWGNRPGKLAASRARILPKPY